MKVIHFCKGYFPELVGGMEQVVRGIAEGTATLGVDTEVICLSDLGGTRTERIGRCMVHFFHTDLRLGVTPISFALWYRFGRLIEDADLIHYHFPYPFSDFIHFAARVRKPSVVTYHSDIVRQKYLFWIYQPLMHKFLSSVDRIVSTSPSYFSTSKVLSCYADKICVIPIGLERTLYPAASIERIAYWRRKVGQKYFLFVGVLRYYKGLFVLLEAARKTRYPVVVVGAGPLEQQLKTMVARQGIGNVEFAGHLPEEDKVALLKLCLGVVLPSHLRSEAFGVSLLEGAMFAKPLISCEIGTGTSFVNIDKETGLVVRAGDSDALSSAMTYIWENQEEAAVMGARAETRYRQEFSAHQMAASYVDLYEEIARKD